MALQSFAGQLTQPTSTGNQAITAPGFTPKVILFWMTDQTTNASAANARMGIGAVSSATSRYSGTGTLDNGVASAAFSAGHDNTKVVFLIDGAATPAVLCAADLVSFDANGFTINWTTVDANARLVNYLALGGTDLTASVGTLTRPVATGNQATTGIGFAPTSVLFFAVRDTATAPPSNSQGSAPRYRIGGGTVALQNQVEVIHKYDTGTSKTLGQSNLLTSQVNTSNNEVAPTSAIASEANLVSLDANGFTLNWSIVTASPRYIGYIALKGIQFSTGTFTQPSATGNQAITGLGFVPKAILLTTRSLVSSTTVDTGARFGLGAATSSTARAFAHVSTKDLVTPANSSQNTDNTKVIKMLTEGGASPTVNAAADLVTMDANGFTLNWTIADATARQVAYFAFGSAATSVNDLLMMFR